jgi:hypothetical protein
MIAPAGDEPETPRVDPGSCPPGDVVAWVVQMLAGRGHQLRLEEHAKQTATTAAGALLFSLGVRSEGDL